MGLKGYAMIKEQKVAKAFWEESVRGDRLEKALREIIQVLGPEATDCGCRGCYYETNEALYIAKQAVKGELK